MQSLNKLFDFLESLTRYHIELGILDDDEFKVVKVDILNTDDTVTEIDMKLGDVMYYTENGTMTIPGKHLLEKAFAMSRGYIENKFGELVNKAIDDNYNLIQFEIDLNTFVIQIEEQVKINYQIILDSFNTISNIINETKEDKFIYDLTKLKDYIKCKWIKM